MMGQAWRRGAAVVMTALVVAALAGCARAPATGEPIFTGGMTETQEKRLGAEQHPKLVKAFGGEYDDGEVQPYVRELGMQLARTSELPGLDWTFTVLDTPMVNAFALPGGYIHVTRGLVALADNEAQLAGVLAHEIGHVTARHSAERYGSQILAGIAGIATGILLGGEAAQAMGSLSQVALSSYSRGQEFEADTLGVRYLARAGYDPEAMAAFLGKMQAEARLEATLRGRPESANRFNILQTHPRTVDRVKEAVAAAGGRVVAEPRLGREAYLAKLDGMTYGYSAEEGFVRDRSFAHPKLRFAFEVPPGFRLVNSTRQVAAFGPEDSLVIFDRATEGARADVLEYMTRTWAARTRLSQVERITVNGMDAAAGRTQVRTREGRRDLRLVAIRYDPETIYRFLFLTPPAMTERLNEDLRRTTYSFRKVSAEEAASLEPLRLVVHTVQSGETQESLAEQMPFAEFRLERFRVLNDLSPEDSLTPGQKVKLVVGWEGHVQRPVRRVSSIVACGTRRTGCMAGNA